MKIEGSSVLITGGARGLGAATCEAFAKRGARVICADIRYDEAAQVAGRLEGAGGVVQAVELDVSNAEEVASVFSAAAQEQGGIDVVVNCAAIDYTEPFDELAAEDFERELDVNLKGPITLSREAYRAMKEAGHGHIINICSTASKRCWPNATPYHTTKWGLLGFTHALQTEARQSGVKVTALVAGGMRTPFLLERFPDIDESTLQDPANVANVIACVVQQPDDCAIPEITVVPMTETSWP